MDIDERFNPTYLIDVCDLAENPKHFAWFYDLKPTVILASPPCERFSQAAHVWPLPGIGKALRVVGACLDIITEMKPEYWALENPALGKLHWFIGKPARRIRANAYGYKTVKPTALWGNVPLALMPHDSSRTNSTKNAFANLYSKRRDKRAEMPYGLSKAILEAVS